MEIGFIGLGNMGMPMLGNLLKGYSDVKVFDLLPKLRKQAQALGGIPVQSADELSDCKVIFSILPAGKHVSSVYSGKEGLLQKLPKNTLFIDSSTIDVETARIIHEEAISKEQRFIDAPVSGGIVGAQAGTLAFLVGGHAEHFESAKPILSLMGKNLFHAGPAGAGQIAKICNNMLAAILMTGTSEALQLGIENGIDPAVLSEIMKASSGGNWSLNCYNPCPNVMPGVPSSNEYKGGFKTSLMIKDLDLAMQNAKTLNCPVPMGSLALQMYRMLAKNTEEDFDFSAIYKLFTK